MAEVFLSYSRTDRPIAQAVALELQRLSVDVWWDHDLLGGDDYRQRISEILSRASVAIVIWSRRSIESQWVVGEASLARQKRIIIPINIDLCEPPLDFHAVHTIDFSSWVPGDQLPVTLINAVAERLNRHLSYASAGVEPARLSRLARNVTRTWYSDAESLLFYFIGQGFACGLVNTPLVAYSSKLPVWVLLLLVTVNGMLVAAIHMRPALETRRMGVAVPLFVLATAISFPAFFGTSWLFEEATSEVFLTLTGFWTLALLLMTDVAKRTSGRK
jgi:hypothetical protein